MEYVYVRMRCGNYLGSIAFNKSVRLLGNNRPADGNRSDQDYQAFQFYIFHGPLSYLYQVHVRSLEAPSLLNHIPSNLRDRAYIFQSGY
jgi:hypothetical protein